MYSCSVTIQQLGTFDTLDPSQDGSAAAADGGHTPLLRRYYPSKRAAKDAVAELAWQAVESMQGQSGYQSCNCARLPELLRDPTLRNGTAIGSAYPQAINMLCNCECH
jgi:hypothetical protein